MLRASIAAAAFLAVVSSTAGQDIDWSGGYAGVGSGLDSASINYLDLRPKGSHSIGAFGGYNWQIAGAIVGVEFSASTDIAGGTIQDLRFGGGQGGFPRYGGFAQYFVPWPGVPTSGSQILVGNSTDMSIDRRMTTAFREEFSGQIGVRVGVPINRTLIYAKLAAGASASAFTYEDDDSRSQYCGATTVREDYSPGRIDRTIVGCLQPYNGSVTRRRTAIVAPTGALALGVEQHFSFGFVRGEVEFRRLFLDDGRRIDRQRGGMSFGVRF